MKIHLWILLIGIAVIISSCAPLVQGWYSADLAFTGSLMTALVIAILGWIVAFIGALQWVRSEAVQTLASQQNQDISSDSNIWVTACHLSPLSGYLIPFGHIITPLIIWLRYRDRCPALDQHGRDVLNFQLSVTLYVLMALFLSFFLIGVFLLFVLIMLHVVLVLYASRRAQYGEVTRYPLSIEFI